MSSLLAEHVRKYGYRRPAVDGSQVVHVPPHETMLSEALEPPVIVTIQDVADYLEMQHGSLHRWPRSPWMDDGAVTYDEPGAPGTGPESLGPPHCLIPPYENMFIEFNLRPTDTDPPTLGRTAVSVESTRGSDGSWVVKATGFGFGSDGNVWMLPYYRRMVLSAGAGELVETTSMMHIDPEGGFLSGWDRGDVAKWLFQTETYTYIAMTAISFFHVKDAEAVEVEPHRRDRKKAQKRGKPLLRHHVLHIKPLHKHMKRVRAAGLVPGSPNALHQVRGNVAIYTEDAPLFGRIVGRVFRPPHWRGRDTKHVVTKDYHVDLGAEGE